MVANAHIIMWLDKCQQNIERMLQGEINAEELSAQYSILLNITKVCQGKAHFLGTQYQFPQADSVSGQQTVEIGSIDPALR